LLWDFSPEHRFLDELGRCAGQAGRLHGQDARLVFLNQRGLLDQSPKLLWLRNSSRILLTVSEILPEFFPLCGEHQTKIQSE
jgi:hypothetical protein